VTQLVVLPDEDQFLASVSHELRTPLTVIGGFSDSLRASVQSPADLADLDPTQVRVEADDPVLIRADRGQRRVRWR
jgi:signal transduction histidine kinase